MHPNRYSRDPRTENSHRTPRGLGTKRRSLCLSLLMCTLALQPAMARQSGAEDIPVPPTSQINRLAIALVDAPGALRADFATAAIAEMVADYNEEARQARREARGGAGSRDLARWSVAVDAYVEELTMIADRVHADTPIGMTIGADNTIILDIDGRPVLVSSPRPREQSALEQRVLTRFCDQHPCKELIADYQPPHPPTAATRDPEIVWNFSQQAGPTCSTSEGLEFQFRDLQDLRQKRTACASVVRELNVLATALAWHIANGDHIDWNRLVIHGSPDGAVQQVELAAGGDTVRLPLPALASTPRLFKLVRPWLAAKAQGQPQYRLVVLNADELMASLLHP
jgi:hypothetical protein